MSKSRVFVSYARPDAPAATLIAQQFTESGFNVFIDRQIVVGESWDDRLEAELLKATAVVALWSREAVASKWVRREARYAASHEKLFPAIIETCLLPIEFSDIQTVDLAGRVGDWRHPEWTRLISALHLPRRKNPNPTNEALAFHLGLMHLTGDGAPRDTTLALRWLCRAFEQGKPEAGLKLAEIHGAGIDVPRDVDTARRYYDEVIRRFGGSPAANRAFAALQGLN